VIVSISDRGPHRADGTFDIPDLPIQTGPATSTLRSDGSRARAAIFINDTHPADGR
jgi:hypothetical protein